MAEPQAAPQSDTSTEEKKGTPGNIVSRGPVTPATLTPPAQTAAPAATGEAQASSATDTGTAAAEETKLPEVNDDQLKALLKEKGIELDDTGLDGLKEKLKPAAAAQAPEDIQKQKEAEEAAFDKRMLDYFIENGGTAESFVAFKQIASSDLTAISEATLRREMKDEGFDDDVIAEIIKERYYQIKLDELVQGEEEEDDDFAKRKAKIEKKIAFGVKDFGAKGSFIKKQAEDALSTLRNQIKSLDEQKAKEVEDSKRVDDFFAKAPKKMTFQLGKAGDGQDIPPVEIDIPETVIAEVHETLKDPAKRKQFLFNQDNSLNLDNVATVMIRNKILEAALAKATIDGEDRGSTRQVEIFEKMFPVRTAKDIGVGGGSGGNNGQGRKGHVVSAGKPEIANPRK